jgi:glycosyltransferase involved in cell wall biosynthesis
MKIAIITCYFDPDIVRARSLRAALDTLPGVEVVVVKNSTTGMLRYPQILWRLWRTKHQTRPDVYLLTFRGQEILPLVLWLAGKKPVWFDEYIVPIAYATGEKHVSSLKIKVFYFLARVSVPFYKRWLRHCTVILTDTKAHAELSSRVSAVDRSKYLAVPVGTDEHVFTPAASSAPRGKFQVFYYSTGMQPLHGIPVVMAAAEQLKDNPHIEFFVGGGKRPMEHLAQIAQTRGARVKYARWIPFEDLMVTTNNSAVCLGGPFGDTPQAHHVITGKTYQFLACARPVIIGASDATNEYFIDKHNALVVPQGNAAALAKAITWAYEHPETLAYIAVQGRKLYEQEFSTQAIARILQPLVANP